MYKAAMARIPLADAPPLAEDRVTSYDMAHAKSYLRLLDAAEEGADWKEAAAIVLDLDVVGDADRSERVHAAHLERARWMTRVGWRHLFEGNVEH